MIEITVANRHQPSSRTERTRPNSAVESVMDFLDKQVRTQSPAGYKRLTQRLARIGKGHSEGSTPIPAPFLREAKGFLSKLPAALSEAEKAHAEVKQNPNLPDISLTDAIKVTNVALKLIIEGQSPPSTVADLKGSKKAAEQEPAQKISRDRTVVKFKKPGMEEHASERTEQRTEPGNILEALDKQLEEPSREEYQALLKKLGSDASSGTLEEADTVFVKFLPKALQYATAFAKKNNMDWRVVTQLANYALLTYIEEKDPEDGDIKLNKIQTHLNNAFKKDLENPFVDTGSLSPLAFKKEDEENAKDERDRGNILAIKRARIAKKVKKELSEKGKTSLHTQKVLDNWGVSEISIARGADRIIQEGERAGNEITLKYNKMLKDAASAISKTTNYTHDQAYGMATLAFMLLVYEQDFSRAPFEALVIAQLPNRITDVLREEQHSVGFVRNGPATETRSIFNYLLEHGLEPTGPNLDKAILETGSSITAEEAREHRKATIIWVSTESILGEDKEDSSLALEDTLTGHGTTIVPRHSVSRHDPTSHMAIGGVEERKLEDVLGIVFTKVSLKPKQRDVLLRYYVDRRNMLEIARELGVTESRVCQIHAEAIARIRSRAQSNPEFGDTILAGLGDAFAAA